MTALSLVCLPSPELPFRTSVSVKRRSLRICLMTKQARTGPRHNCSAIHMVHSSLKALQLPYCALSPRLQQRSSQCRVEMRSAPRHHPHSWSDDPAELPGLADKAIEAGPAALTSMIRVSCRHAPRQAGLSLGMS